MIDQPQWRIVLSAQVISCGLTLLALWRDVTLELGSEHLGLIAQTLTLVMIAAGIAGYLQAGKGRAHPGVLITIASVTPLHAWLGGPLRVTLNYAWIGVTMHLLILWRQWKGTKKT